MDKCRDVRIKVMVEDMEHCNTECQYFEGDERMGLCIFGSLSLDPATRTFTRHSECYMSEL